MTTLTVGPLEVTRLMTAGKFSRCPLVPGHFILAGSQIGWAVPVDPNGEPVGWVCGTCRARLEAQPQTVEDLSPAAYAEGDLAVVWAGRTPQRTRCAVNAKHWRFPGDPTGLVVRLAGLPADPQARDRNYRLGFCCGQCLKTLISR